MKYLIYIICFLFFFIDVNAQQYKKGDVSIGIGPCSVVVEKVGGFVTMDYDLLDFGGIDGKKFSLLIGGDLIVVNNLTYNDKKDNKDGKYIFVSTEPHIYVNWNTKLNGFMVYSGLKLKPMITYCYEMGQDENANKNRWDIRGCIPAIPLGFKYFFNDNIGMFVDFAFPTIDNRIGITYKF